MSSAASSAGGPGTATAALASAVPAAGGSNSCAGAAAAAIASHGSVHAPAAATSTPAPATENVCNGASAAIVAVAGGATASGAMAAMTLLPASAGAALSQDSQASERQVHGSDGSRAAVVVDVVDPDPKSAGQSGGVLDAATPEICWASDAKGEWCARAKRSGGGSGGSAETVICGFRHGEAVWEHPFHGKAQRMACEGGLVAVASDRELHILSTGSGRLVLPPVVLSSVAAHIALSPSGKLLILRRDASLTVWDVPRSACRVETSLRGVCRADSVHRIRLHRDFPDPIIQLKDGSLIRYHTSSRCWATMRASNAEGRSVLQAEGECLLALCLGDKAEFRAQLRELASRCAQREHHRLRSWCQALLGMGSPIQGTSTEWFDKDLASIGVTGISMVREVILPAIHAASGGLRAEMEGVLASASITSGSAATPAEAAKLESIF